MRITLLTVIFVVIMASAVGMSLDTVRANRATNALQDRDPMRPLQHVVASKTAKFGTVDKDDAAYKNALHAHDLAGALKLVGKMARLGEPSANSTRNAMVTWLSSILILTTVPR